MRESLSFPERSAVANLSPCFRTQPITTVRTLPVVMAMPILLVALYLMMAHVVSAHILHTTYLAGSPQRARVAIPEDGIYIVSATLDGDRSRAPELSVLTVYKNNRYMFQGKPTTPMCFATQMCYMVVSRLSLCAYTALVRAL